MTVAAAATAVVAINPVTQAFLDRVAGAVRQVDDLTGTSQWLIDHTKDPRNSLAPWSFTDHEYQIAILDDGRPHVVVAKCSQVGLSEIVARLQLALLAIYPGIQAIYTLPTTTFARKFTKTRIDTIIAASPLLKSMVNASADSSELKQLGNSFLNVLGSFSQGGAISIPADVLINDEVDFSCQQTLTTFASRLGHAKLGGGEGIRREFSTPTVDGFGISKRFQLSTQAHYGVLCDSCQSWQTPDFFDHVVIPGFDEKIINFSRDDLHDPRVDISQAYLTCPGCKQPLTQANLCEPAKRQWIEKFPGRSIGGYQVYPYDVPRVNPVSKTLGYIADYEKKADWVNFKVGLPFEDAESAFLEQRIDSYTSLRAVRPLSHAASGCVMGVDVGKVSWAWIGKPMTDGQIHLLHLEQIKQDGQDYLHTRLMELMECYGVVKAVIDAAPDFTTALKLIEHNFVGRVFGCYYTHTRSPKLTDEIVDERTSVLKTYRTGSLDSLVKDVNGGSFRFPVHPEMELAKAHLSHLKRVKEMDSRGDLVGRWINTGPDHYGHALNYLLMAVHQLGFLGTHNKSPGLPLISKTRLNSGATEATQHPLADKRHGRT
jgi:hypothetical protein